MRRAIVVDERFVVEADGVDDERIALVVADRFLRTTRVSDWWSGGTFNQMRRASAFPEKTITTLSAIAGCTRRPRAARRSPERRPPCTPTRAV